ALDPAADVRCRVAENARTHPGTLCMLARDCDDYVRKLLAAQEFTPYQALRILARDANLEVRQLVVRRNRLTAGILEELSNDKNIFVRELARLRLSNRANSEAQKI